MKKGLALTSSIALILFISSTTLYSETISIGHSVDVLDEFSIKSKNISKFTGTSATEVAEINVINNTRDGYKVTLKCTYGALHSASDDNGEADIPYTLSKSQSGAVPSSGGGFTTLTIPTTPPTNETLILGADSALSGNSLLNDPTDIEFTIKVAISDANFLNMAGTYSDTITIAYNDI